MATLKDPEFYEVQITVIPHGGSPGKEYNFPKVERLDLYQQNGGKTNFVQLELVAIVDEGKGYHTLNKDLALRERCHCYEDLQKED